MKLSEYKAFQQAFDDFMESEGLENLSSDPHTDECPRYGERVCSCETELLSDEQGPHESSCATVQERADECECEPDPFFSWMPCDCCKGLAGNRERASGYNRKENRVQVYDEVCTDCLYYAEYGTLDDMTIIDMEDDTEANDGEKE